MPKLKSEAEELKRLAASPDFYSNPENAKKIGGKLRAKTDIIEECEGQFKAAADLADLIDLAAEEDAQDLIPQIEEELKKLQDGAERLDLSTLLKGGYDANNAILSLHSGAGGTEAQDWVQMLYRMYRMYCDKNNFTVKELDYLPGDEAGIKSVTFSVSGANAYGYLKAEKGVHRLVRVSPFDANSRRHTSFASLDVMPEIEEDSEIKIEPDDLRIDTFRSGGAGGQHVNKTDSAVRITHLPSGIVVQCQNERSQIQNRETAMRMLMSKLVEKRERENAEKAQSIQGELKRIEWGSQIRSYVFHPYSMVKDHRTGFETGNVQAVMDGDLNGFIFDYLRKS